MNPSPLATVMSQLFPFFMGGTLNLKEIVSNKDLIISALQAFAIKAGGKNLCVDNGKLYPNSNGTFVGGCGDQRYAEIWKWFSDNFLSLTFVKVEGYSETNNQIQGCILVATAITKLYSRFNIASVLTVHQQDAIHSIKHKFDMWMCDGRNNDGFTISLEEVALMQQILLEWNSETRIICNDSFSEWVRNTTSRIEDNIASCLSYLETVV